MFPIDAAGFFFGKMGTEIAAVFESLPARIRRDVPGIKEPNPFDIRREIAKARNSAVDISDRLE